MLKLGQVVNFQDRKYVIAAEHEPNSSPFVYLVLVPHVGGDDVDSINLSLETYNKSVFTAQ